MNEKFLEIYQELLHFDNINDSSQDKVYLGEKPKQCRFCGKKESETSFKKVAHAISENAGNKIIISNYECDECNYSFGKCYEDSFGKYILPFKIISHIYGKKTSIKYKDKKRSVKLSKTGHTFRTINTDVSELIVDKGNMSSIVPLQDGSGFTLNLKRQTYSPKCVYLALLKMAYSIMPSNLLDEFVHSVSLLKLLTTDNTSKDKKEKILSSFPYIGFLGFTPGIQDIVNAKLYIRKEGSDIRYPKCVFILKIGNYLLQIPVPSDSHTGGKLSLLPYLECEDSTVNPINFNDVEYDFSCEFKADMQKLNLSTNIKAEIIEILKSNNML